MFDLESAVALQTRVEALMAWIRTKCPASWIRPTIDEILSLPAVPGRKSRLEVLPSEILLEIFSYLPLGSQACVALCSRTLSKKVGMEYWIMLQRKRLNHDEVYLSFLQLLQRDMFPFYLCRRCLKLHSMDGDMHSRPWLEKDKGKEHHMKVGGSLGIKLAFDDVQLAMARHRYNGLQDGGIGAFRYAEYRPRYSASGFTVQLFNMEARSVSDRLLLRTQTLLEMDLSSIAAIKESEMEFKDCLCSHVDWTPDSRTSRRRSAETAGAGRGLAECFNDHSTASSKQECDTCGFRPLCPCCPTETSLQKLPLKPDGCLAVITHWFDLGSVLIPGDPRWQAHIARSSPHDPLYPREFASWGWAHPQWGLTRIRERFEEQHGVTVEELTAIQTRKINSGKWPSPRVRISITAVSIFILLVYLAYRFWPAITGNGFVATANALDWLVCFLQISHCLFQLSTTNFLPYLLDSDR